MADILCIAGICVGFCEYSIDNNDFLSFCGDFRTITSRNPDILFRFVTCPEDFRYPQTDFYIDPLSFHRAKDGLIYFLSDSGDVKVTAKANVNWKEIEIRANTSMPDSYFINLLTDIAFRSRLPEFSGFSLHSSIVEINGSSILFVGPSGIGKSTQAELWRERYGAAIINGDYGIIRQIGNNFQAFGSPWSGTSPYKVNKDYPVSAVFLLEQSENNEINLLQSYDMMQGFLPHCLLPYWHKPSLALALDIINNFLETVPVYQLKCRPDFEAVEMAHAILKL